jgi:hypothetical protein
MTKLIPLVLVALMLLASVATAAPRARSSACDTVRAGGNTYIFYHQGVGCRFGKTWVKRLVRSGGSNKPQGFRCTSGSGFTSGGQCVKKGSSRVVFGWHPGD